MSDHSPNHRSDADRTRTTRRLIILLTAVLILTAAGLGAYLWRMGRIDRDLVRNRDEGLAALRQGDYPLAMQKMGPYLKRHTEDPQTLYAFAQARQKVEEPSGRHLGQAIAILRHVLELTEKTEKGSGVGTSEPVITYARYLAEHAARERNQHYIDAAYWLAERFGVGRADAQDWHVFCESVINSALLVLFTEKKPGGFFSVDRFTKLADAARKKRGAGFGLLDAWLAEAPPAIRRLLERECTRFSAEVLPILRDTPATEIYRNQDRFSGLFFFDAHSVSEITHHDKARAEEWQKNHRHPGRARGRAVRRAPDGRLRPRTRPQPAQERRAGHLGRLQRRGLRRRRRGPLHRQRGALRIPGRHPPHVGRRPRPRSPRAPRQRRRGPGAGLPPGDLPGQLEEARQLKRAAPLTQKAHP